MPLFTVITPQVITSLQAVKVRAGHTHKTKIVNDGKRILFLKKKCVDNNCKKVENLSKANAVKEKVILLDHLEFLPILPYSELLIWLLPAQNVTDHSYFDSVYLKLFTALPFLAN